MGSLTAYSENRFSYNANVSATNSWVSTNLSRSHNKIHIENLDMYVSSISGAANVTWYLSIDAAGNYPINTPQENKVWKDTKVSGRKALCEAVARTICKCDRGSGLYLHTKLDAGTAKLCLL